MNPSELSRAYAAIIPTLDRLGYRADLKDTRMGERFCFMVSGTPTVHVYNTRWEREDGETGRTPADLLDLYRSERSLEAVKHLAARDLKGMCRDVLVSQGIQVGAILSVSESDEKVTVEYRPRSGSPETVVLESLKKQVSKAIEYFDTCA